MKKKIVLMFTLASSFLLLTGCCSYGGGCLTNPGCGYNECYSYNSRCGLPSCTYQCYVNTFDYPCAGLYGCDGY